MDRIRHIGIARQIGTYSDAVETGATCRVPLTASALPIVPALVQPVSLLEIEAIAASAE